MKNISDITFSAIVFAISMTFFIFTLYPTVSLSDSGELSAVCATLGIAHPTGYPVYTILGRIFVFLLPFVPPALATNLMSAIFASLAGVVLFLLIRVIGSSSSVALFSSLFLPLGKVLWAEAIATEVYALSAFLQICMLLFLFLWDKHKNTRWFLLFAYTFGLCITHHMSTVLYIPAILFLIWKGRKKLELKAVIISVILFILALTLYLYIPIRSAQFPKMNWGAPTNFEKLFHHLSGWQYRTWMFSTDFRELLLRAKNMLSILVGNCGIHATTISLIGFIGLIIRKQMKKLFFLILVIAADAFYAINYGIPDISPYYIPTAIMLTLGICGIEKLFPKQLSTITLVASIAVTSILNFCKLNHSNDYSAREYGENVLSIPPANSLVILGSWDMYAPAKYLQICENIKPSVALVDLLLLKRSWYVEQLLRDERFSGAKSSATNFLRVVKPFEQNEKYDGNVIQRAYETMIVDIVRKWNGRAFAFVVDEFFWKLFRGTPTGILWEIDTFAQHIDIPPTFIETGQVLMRKNLWDERQKVVYEVYPRMFLYRAGFLHGYGRFAECEENLLHALKFHPDEKQILENLLTVRMEQRKYEEALSTIEKISRHYTPAQIEILRQDILRKWNEDRDSILDSD